MDDTVFQTPSGIEWQGNTGVVQYGGGDKGMVCLFYNRPVLDPARSRETGRPYHKDVVYVRIHPPGERLNIVERPATTSDQQRWPQQWQQFAARKEQTPDGTPIELLYPEHPAVGATLRANAVHTIEQCAGLSGPAIDNIGMGAQQYSNDAKRYLDAANKGVTVTHMRSELEHRDRELATLRRQVTEMQGIIDQLRTSNGQMATVGQVLDSLARNMPMPTHMPGRPYDPQAAIIGATHPSADLTRQRQQQPKRRRATLG